MQSEKSYEELLDSYRKLQFRITRFSAIEQELINTRDRLDYELVMYKRLNDFNARALKTESLEDLLQLSVESLVDVLEIECATIVFNSEAFQTNTIVTEGLRLTEKNLDEFKTCLENISHEFKPNTSYVFNTKLLDNKPELNQFDSGLFFNFVDDEKDFSVSFSGFISKVNAPLYNQISDRYKTIFSVFVQQTIALLFNLLSKLKVENLNAQVNSVRQFYESVLNHSPAKILVLDADYKVMFTNERLLEKEPIWKDCVNQSIYDVAQKSELAKNHFNQLIKHIEDSITKKGLVKFEELTMQIDTPQFILRNILPYYNSNQQLEHIIITGVNITDLKLSQQSVLKKNEELKKINSELDNFVYSVSHDLRSPLLSLKGILMLIFEIDKNLSPETEEYLEMAETSVNRLDGTIQEILEYSRNARLKVKPSWVDLKPMVHAIFDDIKFSTNTTVAFKTTFNGSSRILSDHARINTVLKNLIGNAVKYKSNNTDSPFVHLEFENTENQIFIKVIDNGEGISDEAQKRVFEMFYRGTKNSIGTGLGLYICKEIIDKLNGNLSLESKLDQGTTVTVVLPKTLENE